VAADDDVVLIGFPDSIWEPVDGYARLLALLGDGRFDVALGLFPVDDDMRRFRAGDHGTADRVAAIEFKPERAVVELAVGLRRAARRRAARAGRRRRAGRLLRRLARAGRVGALRLSSSYSDLGTREALARAQGESVLLGSGGWMPTAARATCSTLVRKGPDALLIDSGTGVARLAATRICSPGSSRSRSC